MAADVIVVGGGMVGSALAIALARDEHSVVLIEKDRPEPFEPNQAPDLRVSALNQHSVDLIEHLDAWPLVQKMRSQSYHNLECWEKKEASTRFSCTDVDSPQLGYFVENRILQLALLEVIETQYQHRIRVIFDKAVDDVNARSGSVTLDDGEVIESQLIVGADGGNSIVRNKANISVSGWKYSQVANLISVKMNTGWESTTWQQFTPEGPLAFLPMFDNHASLVWYCSKSKSDALQGMSNEELKQAIHTTFPNRLGDFEVIANGRFPIARQHARCYFKNKVIVIGDAAHTINPLAGQGVNLGFKDVSALAESIRENGLNDICKVGSNYQRKRYAQNLLMMSAMDAIYATFSNDVAPIKAIRNIALSVADKGGIIKNQVLKYAMGI